MTNVSLSGLMVRESGHFFRRMSSVYVEVGVDREDFRTDTGAANRFSSMQICRGGATITHALQYHVK